MKCKHCTSEIGDHHVTESIERCGESIERHYCSVVCVARDNGYTQSHRVEFVRENTTDGTLPNPFCKPFGDPVQVFKDSTDTGSSEEL